MPEDTVFTMKLEADLRDDFMAEADAAQRPASQILRELMRDFIHAQREARAYDTFLQQKVQIARDQLAQGLHFSHEEVDAEFAALRAELIREAEAAGM